MLTQLRTGGGDFVQQHKLLPSSLSIECAYEDFLLRVQDGGTGISTDIETALTM